MLDKIENILARLDVATAPEKMDLPGFRLHPLKGELRSFWSVTVRIPTKPPGYTEVMPPVVLI